MTYRLFHKQQPSMAMFHTIFLLVVFVPSIYALSCIPCNQALCVEPINCKGGLVKGVCGCCDVCAKTHGERCGGPWRIHGHCAKGLNCVSRTRMKNETAGFLPKFFQPGTCETDACNKKCGFKEKCKIYKSGRAMCVCPRRCSKARRQPVCGLRNGKQYRNKCKLNRDECFTKKEIGLVPGSCKKCTYEGQKYKFGDARPDAKPCEICICRHGSWMCDMDKNCSTKNIKKSTKARHSCIVSFKNGLKHVVVPCPKGFSCRVSPSDDNVRSGMCKKKKVHKSKRVPKLLEIVNNYRTPLSKQEDGSEKATPNTSPEISEYSKAVMVSPINKSKHVVPTVKLAKKIIKKEQLNGDLIRHVCMATADAGTCSLASLKRWFYNASSETCEQFQYGGCGGNFNNFLSKEKCQDVCHSELHRPPWINIAPKLTEKPSEDMLLEMCHDIKTGMSYRDGEKWNRDECISCTCVSGRDLCIAATCHARCSKPIHVEGKCCPICESDLEQTDKFVNDRETECKDTTTGLWYHSGESWYKDDCVHCFCFEGEKTCLKSMCAKPLCEQPITKDGVCCPICPEDEHQVPKPRKEIKPKCVDSDSGQSYSPGEAWKVNDCISCFCDKNGLSKCHKLTCPKSKCNNTVHLQGRCCPVCPESFHSGCSYDNHLYFQGDFMLLTDMCTLCKCKDSTWNCTKKHCNKTVNGIDSTFSVKNKISIDEQERRKPTSDVSGMHFGSDENDAFIVEDPYRMIGLSRDKNVASDKENTATLNNEELFMFNHGKSSTPSPSYQVAHQLETSTDTNENPDKTYVRKSHLGSRERSEDNRGELPFVKDYKHRRWFSSWHQDVLHVPDSKNRTIYRTKRLS